MDNDCCSGEADFGNLNVKLEIMIVALMKLTVVRLYVRL